MKKLFLFMILLTLLSVNVLAATSGVFRGFESEEVDAGSVVEITIDVSINNETSYMIEENIPDGWEVVNSSGGIIENPQVLRWIVTDNPQTTSFTYSVRAANVTGMHSFSGKFWFDGIEQSKTTSGDVFIKVIEPAEPIILNADVAYIVNKLSDANQEIEDAIEELDYSIEYILASDLDVTDFSKYRIVFIPDKSFDSNIDDIPVNEVKSLVMNTYHLEEFNWLSGSISQTASNQILGANVVNSNVKITEGILGNFKVYTQATDHSVSIPMYYLARFRKPAGVDIVVSTENDFYDSVIAKTEIGASLTNGVKAKERGVFFGITKTEFWTTQSKELFKNSILWLVEGQDIDQDGYFTDEDCNDNDENVYPGADEIEYDGIDQDCSGSDLNDIDRDGYIATQAGGDDCNDQNPLYNPGSIDSTKNCINEAPIFNGVIPDLTWKEDSKSELINIRNYFVDPDEDTLTYNVSATSDNVDVTIIFLTDELVRFESSKDWHGTDWIILSASDSEFTTISNNITLNVTSVADAPRLLPVETIVVNETEIVNFTLDAYDPDSQNLIYNVEDIRFTHIGNNTYEWMTTYNDSGMYFIKTNVTDGELYDVMTIQVMVNNLNRLPVVQDISDKTIDEDTINSFLVYATDPDNETLTYKVISQNYTLVDCQIQDNNLTIYPSYNYYGEQSCEVWVSDGHDTVKKSFGINVNPVNDAPILEEIDDIVVNENQIVEIIARATDVDGDTVSYSINDNRFTKNSKGNFTWQTSYSDEGVYEVEISASDSKLTDKKIIKITVEDINEPPIIDAIADITIVEDSSFTLFENVLSAVDNDGYVSRFKVGSEDKNKVDCEVTGKNLGVTPAKDFEGEASCKIRAYDDKFDYDETTVKIIVTNVNDAPKIISSTPGFNPIIAEDANQEFSIKWFDIDTLDKNVVVRWYVEDLLEGVGNTFNFIGDGKVNEFNVRAVVDDEDLSDSVEWILKTTNIPIADSYGGATTKFDSMSESQLRNVNLVLEKSQFGKIEFLEGVDLTSVANLDEFSRLLNGMFAIDSNTYSVFKNKKAKITFYNLNYDKTPTIYYNSGFNLNPSQVTQVCPDTICTNIEYQNNDLTFMVNGFSTYIAGDTLMCSEASGDICRENEVCRAQFIEARDSNRCCPIECTPSFDDITTCEELNENIELTIREPDNNDEYEIGETIEIEVRIQNNFDEDFDFDIEASLYDLDEDESIEEVDEDVDIDEGDSEKVELEIEIPDDIEDNNFAIYVYVEDEEDRCTSGFVNIDIERNKHDVIIDDVIIFPELVSPGEELNVELKVENIGTSEEDVVVYLENSLLNIFEESSEFEIEEFDEDNKERVNFKIIIPEEAKEKEYTLIATVVFDDGDEKDTLTKSFTVENGLTILETNNKAITLPVILLNSKFDSDEKNGNKEKSRFSKSLFISGLLMMFILIIVGLSIVYFSEEKNKAKVRSIYSKIYNRVYKSF